MNSNFDFDKNCEQYNLQDPELDSIKRDRFELLSAYLDGEVTASERRQVQDWLTTDPDVQQLYQRLIKLRRGVHSLPVPKLEPSLQKTTQEVFQAIDRRRLRKALFWGGSALTAVVVATLAELVPPNPLAVQHHIASSSNSEISSDALMIALNRPIIDIPKATTSNFKAFSE